MRPRCRSNRRVCYYYKRQVITTVDFFQLDFHKKSSTIWCMGNGGGYLIRAAIAPRA
jgi:hypothetical protein